MKQLFNQGGQGSTGIMSNKQAIARRFGVKQSEVVYFSSGQALTGFKVIYDKPSQRAYALPSNLGSVTATTLVDGLLTHSGGTVDLGALAVLREEFVTLVENFTSGFTIRVKNELVSDGQSLYRWDGALPKTVNAGSTPAISEPWVNMSVIGVYTPFGASNVGVLYRPGTNYESAGTSSSPETRPWYHDFRPLGTSDGGDALFSTDGCNMFMGPGAGNFTMRPLPVGSLPAGTDYNLQCSHNIAYGVQALGMLTIGYKNTAMGTNALRKLTTGHGNTATGRDCGHELTTGNDNSFYGFTAGQLMMTGNYNCVFGVSASYNNVGGSGNTISGRRAAFNQTSGDYNQMFGEQAGLGFLSGDYNTFIGKQATSTGLTNGDSNLIIGSRISGLQDEKEQVVIADGAGKKTLEVHKDSAAVTKKASYLDLPSYEVTPFNPAATDGQVTAGSSLLLRSLGNAGNAVTQIVFQSRTGQPFSRIVSSGAGSASMVFINDNIERLRIASNGTILPGADNTQAIGSATKRPTEVFAVAGAINTSDGREKTEPLPITDDILDAWEDVQLVTFQWLAAIQKKGDDVARWHFGVIAQQVRDAFEKHGIDGTRYGLLCFDEWDDVYEPVYATRMIERQEPGKVIMEEELYETGEKILIESAGNRWGIRPDQCLFLEAALQRRNYQRQIELNKDILSRLKALESK